MTDLRTALPPEAWILFEAHETEPWLSGELEALAIAHNPDDPFAALIALANAALPEDDPRKISVHIIDTLRRAVDTLDWNGMTDAEVAAIKGFANGIRAYLPAVHG